MRLITSVANKDKNNYYYNIYLEKGCYKESNTLHFQMNVCISFTNADKYITYYKSIELTFLMDLMLIKQVHKKVGYLSLLVFLKLLF